MNVADTLLTVNIPIEDGEDNYTATLSTDDGGFVVEVTALGASASARAHNATFLGVAVSLATASVATRLERDSEICLPVMALCHKVMTAVEASKTRWITRVVGFVDDVL